MILYVLALLIGVIAGLRAMTAPAAISWAASLGFLNLEGTWLAFLGYRWTPWIMTVLAIGELIGDQLPTTPSRKHADAFRHQDHHGRPVRRRHSGAGRFLPRRPCCRSASAVSSGHWEEQRAARVSPPPSARTVPPP